MLAALIVLAMPAHTLDVYAAASLKEAFATIGTAFEKAHPDTKVRLTFSGSQTLSAQIANGAPADVFASASSKNLKDLGFDPGTKRVFATNRLVVVGGPSFRDLSKAKRIVLGAPAVPAGGYADFALAAAGRKWGAEWFAAVQANVVSRENDVRAVLAKVQLGEADAGIVYASDAKGQPVPPAFQPRIEYPLVVLREAREPGLAKAFVALVLGKAGRQALQARGFGVPNP
ncbi:molybdate ABC transporter substrate-binding protein [soil metagenome]